MSDQEKKIFVVGWNLISNTFLSPGGPVHSILTRQHSLHTFTGPKGVSQFFLGITGGKGVEKIILDPQDKVLFFANTNIEAIPRKLRQEYEEDSIVTFFTSYLLNNGMIEDPVNLIILESESLEYTPLEPSIPIIARKLNGEAYLRALDEKVNDRA